MAEENRCPQCKAKLPADAPEDLCPKCLFKAGGARDANATLDAPHTIDGPGTKIGRYELLEQIGEGGMGLVYIAQQKKPVKRKVALKIIKPGMDSKQVIARFEAERQALAVLDHPNIARVFDAGTTKAGRPYFIMEYVKGMSITRYCDENKLNIEQRLGLFEQVCEGIHHAHQKGIIHRDLKPSNILVSVHGDRAVPKIIDFGIAKAVTQPLTEKTFLTFQGQLLGTPEYMSPEQVDLATQDIDTRSDIYSLGVVLYELLAGVLPFGQESLARLGFAEVQRTIREQEPATPSVRLANLGQEAATIAASRCTQAVALARRLHRELEWIPLKAMRKDRCRRYRSASELADDVRRYLNGLPLIAGPETTLYRMQKFARKHAGSVAMVAVVTLAVVLGLVVSIIMGCRAEQARKQEVAARVQVEQALDRAERAETLAEEKAEDYRRLLYFNRIALAEMSYRNDNVESARELLDLCPEDLRGWEWFHLKHISDQSVMTLSGHKSEVLGVAFSTDGERIISGSSDRTVKVWDRTTGTELMTLGEHEAAITSVSISPNGRRIASVSRDKTIKLWDAESGVELKTLEGHEQEVRSVSFSPDSRRIVSGSMDNTIKLWDVTTGNELMTLEGHESWVNCVVISPDGKRIASGSGDRTVKIWDVETGAELMTLSGHESAVLGVSFSPDGKLIASTGAYDKTIRVWDVSSGHELKVFRGHTGHTQGVAFSPDGKHIVSGSWDGTIKLWNVSTGAEMATLRGHGGEIYSVAFSPDGEQIVSGGMDKTLKLWDAPTGVEMTTLRGHRDWTGGITFSPDGKIIASGGEDNKVKIWDATTGADIATLQGHSRDVLSVVYSPDGRWIASGSRRDNTVRIWDTATNVEVMKLDGQDGWTSGISYSPDGKYVASGGKDATIKVWDATTGAEIMILRGHEGEIYSVAFSPDGMRILSSSRMTQKVWDVRTGNELINLDEHEGYQVWGATFSPDGKLVFSGKGDGAIKVWDSKSGAEQMILRGHSDTVYSLAVSPDGKRLASGSRDKTVKVWDTVTGAEIVTFHAADCVFSVVFSPDGRTVAYSCMDGSIVLLESYASVNAYKRRRIGARARDVVCDLHSEYGTYGDVIGKLTTDKTLDEPIRKIALQIANARLWEDNERPE